MGAATCAGWAAPLPRHRSAAAPRSRPGQALDSLAQQVVARAWRDALAGHERAVNDSEQEASAVLRQSDPPEHRSPPSAAAAWVTTGPVATTFVCFLAMFTCTTGRRSLRT